MTLSSRHTQHTLSALHGGKQTHMPLTDLVHYLNTRDRDQRPFMHLDDPFQATPGGAIAHYARITLDSGYAPIHVAGSGSLHGHAAVLKARGELNDLPLHPEAIFAIPSSNAEFVHLDRLVRTLHALNYLLHPEPQHLYVRINLRHIEIVPGGHGIVFENALRACGLDPHSITLEVNVEDEPDELLRAALESYRRRGYRIALASHGRNWNENHWLLSLKPDVVRLDPELLDRPEQLNLLALRLGDYGIRSLIGVTSATQAKCAARAGVELIQHPLGRGSRQGTHHSRQRNGRSAHAPAA